MSQNRSLDICETFKDIKKTNKKIKYLETYAIKMYKKYNVTFSYMYDLTDYDPNDEDDNIEFMNQNMFIADDGMELTIYGTTENIAKYLYNENKDLKLNLNDIIDYITYRAKISQDNNTKVKELIQTYKSEIKNAIKSESNFINFIKKYSELMLDDILDSYVYSTAFKFTKKLAAK